MDSREKTSMRNIPHAVVMREYGTSRCLNQLASEFRVVAEEHLVMKEYTEMKCDLPHFTRSTYLMVFSPDGKKMASSHGNHNVYVTDVKTGRNLNTLTGHPRTPWCIAFHPSSNQILASGCLGGQVRVWDLHGGSEIWTIEGQTSIASLAFHPSDRLLVIASYNEIYFWDWSQPEPFAKCSTLNEKEKIRYVAFDYSGSKLVTGIEIPKPLQSQWDRVGTGGQPNRAAGSLGTRPSGQRSGFGTVFSRPGQGSVAGTGPTSGPTRGPSSSSPSSSISPPHGNLEGSIRTNSPILLMLLDPIRQINRTQMIRRLITRYSNSMSNTAELKLQTPNRNRHHQHNPSSRRSSEAVPANLNPATVTLDDWYQTFVGLSAALRRNDGGSSNSSDARNRTTGISSATSSLLVNNRNRRAGDILGLSNASCSRSQLTEHVMSAAAGSSHEQESSSGNRDMISGTSSFEEQSSSTVGSAGLQRLPDPTRTLFFNNYSVKALCARLLETIQQNIAILFVQLSSMQYCTVCSPPMNSSHLSHIQQLWLDLREQIGPLQSSVWENINLNATAWHRSTSQTASDMIHEWEQGSQRQSQDNSYVGPTNSASHTSVSSASSSCQPDEISIASSAGSYNQATIDSSPTMKPTGQHASSSTNKSDDASSPTPRTSTDNSGSNPRPQFRSGPQGNAHRMHRSNHLRRALYLRCQNALGRRLGTTAGALRAQRSSHARQLQIAETSSTGASESSRSSNYPFLDQGIHQSQRSSAFSEPEGVRETEIRLEQIEQRTDTGTRSQRVNDTAAGDDENINSAQRQLLRYRLLLGRRRNAPSRISRNSSGRGSPRAQAHRVTPPRYFGGRRSVFEVTLDSDTSRSPEQLSSNSQTSSPATVRTSDNMLMRIFRSLRRAASLSGRSERPLSQDSQMSASADHHQPVLTVPAQPRQESNSRIDQTHDQGPNQSNGSTQQTSLPLWSQNSEPQNDVLDNHVPHLGTVDPAVRETFSSMQPSGSMNIVQDGVMTEDLARNLLRLHLHQQHQELQLRQHQARLRVRLQSQNASQSAVQPQGGLSRRFAQCTLCGGSILIGSHVLLRMDTPSEDLPSTQVSSQTSSSPPVPEDRNAPISSVSSASGRSSPFMGQRREGSSQLFEEPSNVLEAHENGHNALSSIHLVQDPLVPQPLPSITPQQFPEAEVEVSPSHLQGTSPPASSSEIISTPSLTALPLTSQLFPSSPPSPLQHHHRIQVSPFGNSSDLPAHSVQLNPTFAQHSPSNNERQNIDKEVVQKSQTLNQQETENQEASSSHGVLASTSNPCETTIGSSKNSNDSNTILHMPSTSRGIKVTGKSHHDVCSKSQVEGMGTAINDSSSSDSETEGIIRHLRKRRACQTYNKDIRKCKGRRKVDLEKVASPPNRRSIPEAGPSNHSGSTRDDVSKQSGANRIKNPCNHKGIGDSDGTAAAASTGSRRSTIESRMPLTSDTREEENDHGSGVDEPSNIRIDEGPSYTPQGLPFLNLLPNPTFSRQFETVANRLDNLVNLQRNAFISTRRRQRSPPPDVSPLRHQGVVSPVGQDINSGKIDALNSASHSLNRVLETISQQILMVQSFRSHQGSCSEHQNSAPPNLMSLGSQPNLPSFASNVRRRGQELLRVMVDTLSTYTSQCHPASIAGNNQRAPHHMHTLSSAYWLMQGIYILIYTGLEFSDLLLTYFISCYEPNDSVDSSSASVPQPCVCLNSNTSSTSPVSRPPVAPTQIWNGQAISATARDLLPLMFESLRSQFRFPSQSQFSNNINNAPASSHSNESSPASGISAVRRPWLVNLHNVLASARLQQGPLRPHPVPESNLRSHQDHQSEGSPVLQIPVISVPSHSPQVNSGIVESRIRQPTSATYAVVHPVVSSTIRRNISQLPQTSTSQQQENNMQAEASVTSGYSRPGFMRLRSRLLHPPVPQQDQPSVSTDGDLAAQQSLFFHFDYARNIGHIVREPNFIAEEHRVHRIQLWNFSKGDIPVITDGDVNIVVSECKIHNDASVDISADGHLLVALLPPPRTTVNPYMPTSPPGQTVGVYSLVWESLGQLLYTTSLDRPAVSVALSPTAAYLLVGLATRRSILMPTDQHAIAQAFRLEGAKPGRPIGARGRLNLHRHIEAQNAPLGINCIRWAPVSGHGMVYGTNTGALVMLQ